MWRQLSALAGGVLPARSYIFHHAAMCGGFFDIKNTLCHLAMRNILRCSSCSNEHRFPCDLLFLLPCHRHRAQAGSNHTVRIAQRTAVYPSPSDTFKPELWLTYGYCFKEICTDIFTICAVKDDHYQIIYDHICTYADICICIFIIGDNSRNSVYILNFLF